MIWNPFEGYLIYNNQSGVDTLLITADLTSVPSSKREAFAVKGGNAADWAIRILGRSGDAADTDNFALASRDASDGWDRSDRPEPPLIGDYVSISFPHPEWGRVIDSFSTDARSTSAGGAEWTFDVSNRKPGAVDLTFAGLEGVPEDFQILLIDDLLELRQNLRQQPKYTLSSGGEGWARSLRLVVGTEAYLRGEFITDETLPTEIDLFQNFPNPFTGSTTIRYALPERSNVRVDVFNILGRRITTLTSGREDAGYHAIVWDGTNDAGIPIGCGVYFARMRAGEFQKTLSITLIE